MVTKLRVLLSGRKTPYCLIVGHIARRKFNDALNKERGKVTYALE